MASKATKQEIADYAIREHKLFELFREGVRPAQEVLDGLQQMIEGKATGLLQATASSPDPETIWVSQADVERFVEMHPEPLWSSRTALDVFLAFVRFNGAAELAEKDPEYAFGKYATWDRAGFRVRVRYSHEGGRVVSRSDLLVLRSDAGAKAIINRWRLLPLSGLKRDLFKAFLDSLAVVKTPREWLKELYPDAHIVEPTGWLTKSFEEPTIREDFEWRIRRSAVAGHSFA